MADTPDQLKSKSRKLEHGTCVSNTGFRTKNLQGAWVEGPPTLNTYRCAATQATASEGHPWNRSNDYPGDDIGGPFETTKRYLSTSKYGLDQISLDDVPKRYAKAGVGTGIEYWINSHLLPDSQFTNSQETAWPSPSPSSNAELIAMGTKAISLVKPTNSIANLSTSLAELMREGLPHHPGRSQWEERARVARGAGSEYLNAQFGWLPLVADIQDLSKAIAHGDKIWKQYERDAGRLVRRRMEFEPVFSTPVDVSVSSGAFPFPTPNTHFYTTGFPGGTLTVKRYKRQRQWFSGAFTYYIPDRDSSSGVERLFAASAKARKLYGLTLDPEVLWNLTPWSWALDWFANTGDVISNLTDMATDGLVLRYGYMMEETIVSHEHSLQGLEWVSSPPLPRNLTLYAVTKTLKRIRATPYGFGLTFQGFSPRQLAILAALGVTRGK